MDKLTCGCGRGCGCVCPNHQDVPNGLPARECERHRLLREARVAEEHVELERTWRKPWDPRDGG